MTGFGSPVFPLAPDQVQRLGVSFAKAIRDSKQELDEAAVNLHGVFKAFRDAQKKEALGVLGGLDVDPEKLRRTISAIENDGADEEGNRHTAIVYGALTVQVVRTFFSEFMKHGVAPSAISSEAVAMTGLVQWQEFGRPTFRLEDDITSALLMTDIDETAPLSLPFPSFLIQLPRDFLKVVPNAGDQTPVAANRILVSRVDELGFDMETSASYTEIPTADAFKHMLANHKVGHNLVVKLLGSFKPLKHDVYRSWPFTSPETALADLKSGEWSDDGLSASDDENLRLAWRLALNVMQYINSIRQGALPGKKTESAPNLVLERVAPKRWLLGGQIKLSKDIVAAAKAHGNGASGWKLKHQFVVRGHWKNQAVGVGRATRKRLWIEPYWKGPKATETGLLRSFKVEDGT